MSATSHTPKDAKVMAAILKDCGVNEYEPRVINQMLEFAYRYVCDLLEDSKVYSDYAGKKQIDVDDVKLAIQLKVYKTDKVSETFFRITKFYSMHHRWIIHSLVLRLENLFWT